MSINQNVTRNQTSNDEKTRKFSPRAALSLEQRQPTVDVPWVGILRVVAANANLEFKIDEGITLGRLHPGTGSLSDSHIDLTALGGKGQGVSRLHALISVRADCLSIQDMGSTNGTFLNGYRIQPFTDVPLRHNDAIELGRMKLRLLFAAKVTA